ncbi:hypothetical protein MRS76_05735 [Rhizobiaceae bacterium n13]|uniref:Acyl-CoA thioesterase n=1 Tax=Ferirhizobium litorale TaxID=2927786 RepID=A0AAE3U0Q5_9HYPH|nr:thioesterase family protein [Fererhizobium litorale]MDI7861449.1 hypothetical protein [Fererhizobium litorale]MDI7921596.1 hypothetical protein [Fererhizobium litorale]
MKDIERIEVMEARIPSRDIGMDGRMQTPAYFYYAEAALAHFWRYRPPLEDEPAFEVKKAECVYHDSLYLDDVARFTVRINKIGVKSVGANVAVEAADRLCAEIELIWTSVDRESREAVPLPEDIRDWLYQFLD